MINVGNAQVEPSSWRDYWPIQYVFNELPIVGSFFKENTLSKALYDAGKCTAMLAGPAIGLWYRQTDHCTRDDGYTHIAYMTITMAFDMFVAKVAYHSAAQASYILFQYANCCKKADSVATAEERIGLNSSTTSAPNELMV